MLREMRSERRGGDRVAVDLLRGCGRPTRTTPRGEPQSAPPPLLNPATIERAARGRAAGARLPPGWQHPHREGVVMIVPAIEVVLGVFAALAIIGFILVGLTRATDKAALAYYQRRNREAQAQDDADHS
jgi:hypothetical protein